MRGGSLSTRSLHALGPVRLQNSTSWSPRSFRSPSPNLPVVPFVSSCPTLAFHSPITYSTSPLYSGSILDQRYVDVAFPAFVYSGKTTIASACMSSGSKFTCEPSTGDDICAEKSTIILSQSSSCVLAHNAHSM